MKKTFGTDIIEFYKSLRPPPNLPEGVGVLFPQQDAEVIATIGKFFQKYYNDQHKRTLLFGINPGRFGAGVTGVNFTASRQLSENCGITHNFKMQSELSAEFIYEMIERYGGPEKFYANFFIGSLSPLGYVKNGINMNYYDDKELLKSTEPFIIDCISEQLKWNVNRDTCICIGGEKNYKFFSGLNGKYQWFQKIIPLPHPRFIMQYRRRTKENYILQYLAALSEL